MIVRKALCSDAATIALFESLYIDCPWTQAQIEDEIDRGVFLTAEECGEIAGYISGDIVADECELNNIAVAEKFRRRGIAKALMTEFIAMIEAYGVRKLYLLVRADNIPAIALYKSFGFGESGVRKGYYRGADAIIMERG